VADQGAVTEDPEDPISDMMIMAVESVLPLYHLSVAISGPIAAFKSAYVSGVWLGAEVGRDPVAAARLARWLEETIPSGGRTEDDREFVERLTKTLLATP
jgi:hypothetical protein